MTKEKFAFLQELHRLSGLRLLEFLKQEYISNSTYKLKVYFLLLFFIPEKMVNLNTS